ncbi:hypothetical protein SS05631_a48410 (plasmid) [Sinorhizobium sp. CCBAU 05631]|nr:hypothetical protein SS05631_a48410 [Sinorhizobium sp. CCBAU 05631]
MFKKRANCQEGARKNSSATVQRLALESAASRAWPNIVSRTSQE